MTGYELTKIPKDISNDLIDQECNKQQMANDLRWAYKKGMKDMRDIIINLNKQNEKESKEVIKD